MITGWLLDIVSAVLNFFLDLLPPWTIPAPEGFENLMGFMAAYDRIIPATELLGGFTILAGMISAFYAYKGITWLLPIVVNAVRG